MASVIAFSNSANFSATESPRIASRHAGFPRTALPFSTIESIQPRPEPSRHSFHCQARLPPVYCPLVPVKLAAWQPACPEAIFGFVFASLRSAVSWSFRLFVFSSRGRGLRFRFAPADL